MSGWRDVAPVSELAPGTVRVVEVDGVPVAVFNCGGELLAVEDLCSHDDAELSGGEVEGSEVICPRHGARFDLRTGEALTPPAHEPVACYPVRVVDGRVQVGPRET